MLKGKLITVFGGSGALGHALIKRLAAAGARIRVAERNPEHALSLKIFGEVGQIVPVQIFLDDPQGIEAACRGAECVINLVGRLFEKGRSTFDLVHVTGPQTVARTCAKLGVKRLIHVSAIGADGAAASRYLATKGLGEQKVTAAFPGATLLRPSVMIGPNDRFLNRFGALAALSPVLVVFAGGRTKMQPIYVGDVADAIVKILDMPKTAGHVFELGGPEVYTFKELLILMLSVIQRKRLILSLPAFVGKLMGWFFQMMPEPLITSDQIKMLDVDTIVHKGVKTFQDLGIKPQLIEAILPTYLSPYRPRF
jgi:uncharacterized protein YbjT (DUF2867 family)